MRKTTLRSSCLLTALALIGGLAVQTVRANDSDYEAPAGYYTSAAGLTGSALQTQLRTIMSTGFVGRSYGDYRYASVVLDADPAHSGNIILIYNDASVSATWDSGITWNREHLWPVSLLGDDDPSNSQTDMRTDEFLLRPCNPSVNSARGNEYYGAAGSSGAYHDYGSYWFPGSQDSGDVARSMFYAVTRYTSYNGHAISLVDGAPSTYQMGDLNALLHWHYTDTPDEYERRRNQAVYSSTMNPTYYQGNRNAFIDHPEYVWSIFVDQENDTTVTTSTHSVNLGKVLVGSSLGTANVTINKTGADGTYYEVRTDGSATSTITGHYNAFGINSTGSAVTTVGLNTSTATAGLKTGTVTVDNLDITTQGGAGKGANDGDDVVTVSATVVDHASPSFSSSSSQQTVQVDFGTVQQNTGQHTLGLSLYNLMQTSGYTAMLDLDAVQFSGDSAAISSDLAAAPNLDAGDAWLFSVMLETSMTGTFQGTYLLTCSDEDIPGELTFSPLTVNVTGTVDVPEPAALLLLSLGGLLVRRRRR